MTTGGNQHSSAVINQSLAREQPSAHATNLPNKSPSKNLLQRLAAIEFPLVCILIGIVLIYGWLQSDEGHLTAETGAGYYLGISGSLLLLTLLLYPLRKRFRGLRFIGGVKSWFRIHMLLGIIGPTLIVLHSNYSAGSLNSTVALGCMLVVAGSGFIGRFLYSRTHRGLYGRKAKVSEFLSDAGILKQKLNEDLLNAPEILERLKEFETRRLDSPSGLVSSMWRAATSVFVGRQLRNQVLITQRKIFDQRADQEGWTRKAKRINFIDFRKHLNSYFRAISRAEAFTLYERLFALWHMLHLPLFIILVFAVLAHVVAVHLY